MRGCDAGKLLDNIQKHPDVGFYLGELIMNNLWRGPPQPQQPANPDKRTPAAPPAAEGVAGAASDDAQAQAMLENLGQTIVDAMLNNNGELQADNLPQQILSNPQTKAALAALVTSQMSSSNSKGGAVPDKPGTAIEAMGFYMQSSQKGHVLAQHRVAHMLAYGVGTPRSCGAAVAGFKVLAERGEWMKGLTAGHRAYDAGAWRESLAHFSMLAALGVETAQFNAAHILSRKLCPAPLYLGPVPVPVGASGRAADDDWEGNVTVACKH
jgi:TPR repeat protein